MESTSPPSFTRNRAHTISGSTPRPLAVKPLQVHEEPAPVSKAETPQKLNFKDLQQRVKNLPSRAPTPALEDRESIGKNKGITIGGVVKTKDQKFNSLRQVAESFISSREPAKTTENTGSTRTFHKLEGESGDSLRGSLETPRGSLETPIRGSLEDEPKEEPLEQQTAKLEELRSQLERMVPIAPIPTDPTYHNSKIEFRRIRAATLRAKKPSSAPHMPKTPRSSIEDLGLLSSTPTVTSSSSSRPLAKIPSNHSSKVTALILADLPAEQVSVLNIQEILLGLFTSSKDSKKSTLKQEVLAFLTIHSKSKISPKEMAQALCKVRDGLLPMQLSDPKAHLLKHFYEQLEELFQEPLALKICETYLKIHLDDCKQVFSKDYFSTSYSSALKIFFYSMRHEFYLMEKQYQKLKPLVSEYKAFCDRFTIEFTSVKNHLLELYQDPVLPEFYDELSSLVLNSTLFPLIKAYLDKNNDEYTPLAKAILSSKQHEKTVLNIISDLGTYELAFQDKKVPFRGIALSIVLTSEYGKGVLASYFEEIKTVIESSLKSQSTEELCIDYNAILAQLEKKKTFTSSQTEEFKTNYIHATAQKRIDAFTVFCSTILNKLYSLPLPKEGKELLHIYRLMMRKDPEAVHFEQMMPGNVLFLRIICPTITDLGIKMNEKYPFRKPVLISLAKTLQHFANHTLPTSINEKNEAFNSAYARLYTQFFAQHKKYIEDHSV